MLINLNVNVVLSSSNVEKGICQKAKIKGPGDNPAGLIKREKYLAASWKNGKLKELTYKRRTPRDENGKQNEFYHHIPKNGLSDTECIHFGNRVAIFLSEIGDATKLFAEAAQRLEDADLTTPPRPSFDLVSSSQLDTLDGKALSDATTILRACEREGGVIHPKVILSKYEDMLANVNKGLSQSAFGNVKIVLQSKSVERVVGVMENKLFLTSLENEMFGVLFDPSSTCGEFNTALASTSINQLLGGVSAGMTLQELLVSANHGVDPSQDLLFVSTSTTGGYRVDVQAEFNETLAYSCRKSANLYLTLYAMSDAKMHWSPLVMSALITKIAVGGNIWCLEADGFKKADTNFTVTKIEVDSIKDECSAPRGLFYCMFRNSFA